MGVFARYDLKRYCIPEKACNFIFSTKTPSKNKTFAKKSANQMASQFFFTVTSCLNYQNSGKFLV